MKKLILIGNVGKTRFSEDTGGDPVLEFSLAVNESKAGAGDEREQVTTWFTCEIWGDRAVRLKDTIKTRSYLYVEGNPHVEAYLTKDETPKAAAKIVCRVRDFHFLGAAPKDKDAADA